MDVFCMAGVHQQPEQSNYLPGTGQWPKVKLKLVIYLAGDHDG